MQRWTNGKMPVVRRAFWGDNIMSTDEWFWQLDAELSQAAQAAQAAIDAVTENPSDKAIAQADEACAQHAKIMAQWRQAGKEAGILRGR